MNIKAQTPKATIRVLGVQGVFKIYGRDALEFRVWWESSCEALQGTKVAFYDATLGNPGHTFVINRSKKGWGFRRSSLTVKFD